VTVQTSISIPFYRCVTGVTGKKGGRYIYLGAMVAWSTDSCQAVAPNIVKEDRGLDVAEAVFGNLAMTTFGNHRVHVAASDALCFGRFDAEGFAIKIEVESARCAVTSADIVKSELLGKIAVRLGLETIAEPIFAGNGYVEERGTEVDEWNIESASVEGDDCLIAFGDVPKVGEEFGFVHAWNKLDRTGFTGAFVEIGRSEEDLATRRLGVEHCDADNLRGERPQAALLADFSAASGASGFVGDAFAFAEEVFLLDFVELLEWESGGFDVENEFSHCAGRFVAEDGKIEQEETERTENEH
jgi:hypothetical protein